LVGGLSGSTDPWLGGRCSRGARPSAPRARQARAGGGCPSPRAPGPCSAAACCASTVHPALTSIRPSRHVRRLDAMLRRRPTVTWSATTSSFCRWTQGASRGSGMGGRACSWGKLARGNTERLEYDVHLPRAAAANRHQWYWDSCFRGSWAHTFEIARAREELRTLLRAARPDASVPATNLCTAPPRVAGRRAVYYATSRVVGALPTTRS